MGWRLAETAPDGADRCPGGPSATPRCPRRPQAPCQCLGRPRDSDYGDVTVTRGGCQPEWPRGPRSSTAPPPAELPQQPRPPLDRPRGGGLAQLPFRKGAPWWEEPRLQHLPQECHGVWAALGITEDTPSPHLGCVQVLAVPSSASSPSPSRGGGGGCEGQGSVPPGGGSGCVPLAQCNPRSQMTSS